MFYSAFVYLSVILCTILLYFKSDAIYYSVMIYFIIIQTLTIQNESSTMMFGCASTLLQLTFGPHGANHERLLFHCAELLINF